MADMMLFTSPLLESHSKSSSSAKWEIQSPLLPSRRASQFVERTGALPGITSPYDADISEGGPVPTPEYYVL